MFRTTKGLDLHISQAQPTNIGLNPIGLAQTLLINRSNIKVPARLRSKTGTRTLTDLKDSLSALLMLRIHLTARATAPSSSQTLRSHQIISDHPASELSLLFPITKRPIRQTYYLKSLFRGLKLML